MDNAAIALAPKTAAKSGKKLDITTHQEFLATNVGPVGSLPRMEFEAKSHAFQLCTQLINLRMAAGLTQQQLADKIGAKRAYIARIEKGHIDIQLSTYLRFLEGLGYQLKISPEPV